jgi:predicted phage-related endonuclease
MRAGHYLEDAVARFWHDETGREIIKRSAGDWIMRDNEKTFLQVSPDRTYWLGESKRDGKGILECKTTQASIDADDLPKQWFCQVQYQLGVSGFQRGSIAWLCSGRYFGYKDLAFVPDFYEWLAEEAEKFWYDYVVAKAEPISVSVQDVLLKYNRHTNGKVLEVDDEVFKYYQDLKDIRKQIDALEERKETLEGRIKLAFGDAEAISYGGDTLATWKAPKPSRKFDYKTYQKDHADLCEPYIIESIGARRFLLK